MRLTGMMFGHAFHDGANVLGDFRAQRLLHDCAHFRFVRLDAWRQPKGGGASPFSDVGCAMLESPAADALTN